MPRLPIQPVVDSMTNTLVTEGGQVKQSTQNMDVEGSLNDLLKESKKTNLHLAILTDNYIRDTEVE